ncbi:MAG: hypothetical protein IKW99_05295 [Bacteroidales bacterium]|nr:hypothetical protein [Bacteroidales bacterium]
MIDKLSARILAAITLLALFSCTKVEEIQDEGQGAPGQPAAEKVYSFNISASKSAAEPGSRALSLDGKVLNALWAEGEEVTAYNETKGAALEGSLVAQTSGANTTLKGDLTGTIAANDILTLKFLSPAYGTQDGTLTGNATSIDKVCDYATATVTVDAVETGKNVIIKEPSASFTNRQAIVKFTLFQEDGTTVVPANPLNVVVGDVTYTVTPASPTNELFVAVPAIQGKKIMLTASTEGDEYYYVKNSATFEIGKYYSITVKMTDWTIVFNETELKDTVAAGRTKIRLGSDIPLTSCFHIGESVDQTVTVDLNGKTLSRNLASADINGHVIEVHSKGTLTIIDNDGDGKISGGRANNGGGICNYGTLYFEGGTITDCLAANQGGGIKNNSGCTVQMTGGIILGCWGQDGGGIFNAEGGSLFIDGGAISGNTSAAGGGGVVNYGEAFLSGMTINNNDATTNGGGVWNGGELSVYSGDISNCKASAAGGGIFNKGDLKYHGGVIQECYGTDGGGVYNAAEGSFLKRGGKITGNTSGAGGGGVVNYGTASLWGSGGSIRDNHATTRGGGVWNGGTLEVWGEYIDNNKADIEGGGIYLKAGSTTSFKEGYLSGNTSAKAGGIHVDGTLNIEGTITVSDNKRDNGLPSNVFLTTGKTINVTGNLSDSRIGVELQGRVGVITSGYLAHNGNTGHFFADLSPLTSVEITASEATLTQNTGTLYYIERGWNGTMVTEEIKELTEPYVILGSSDGVFHAPGTTGASWFVVNQQGVSIYRFEVDSGTINLLVCDGASLECNILLHSNATLRIFGQLDNTGSLNAVSRDNAAIGGGSGTMGTLIIHGPSIKATGDSNVDKHTPGIGSGPVVIYGGTVNATGSKRAAGIGGGQDDPGGTVTIYGGNVTAVGGGSGGGFADNGGGAGIGGGVNAGNGVINIYGGVVNATGRSKAAGIGGGACGTQSGAINIYGGEVYATGGEDSVGGWAGAGIGGGGNGGSGGVVNISGGYVKVEGKEGGAAIGGGACGSGGTTTISGGRVFVVGSSTSAAIGGGRSGNGGTIIITGGDVEAVSDGATALGSGDDGTQADVRITGGTVYTYFSEGYHKYYDKPTWPTIGSDPMLVSYSTVSLGDNIKVTNWSSGQVASWSERATVCMSKNWGVRITECGHSTQSGPCAWCLYNH